MKYNTLDSAAKDFFPMVEAEMKAALDEHSETWSEPIYDAYNLICGDDKGTGRTGYDVLRKIRAFEEDGDPRQLTGAVVYILIYFAQTMNRETECID